MQRHQVRTSGGNIEVEQAGQGERVNLTVPKEQNQLTRDEARQLGERLITASGGQQQEGKGQSGGSQSPTRGKDQS